MLKNYFFIVLVYCILYPSLFAITLKDSVLEVLHTNPLVQERLKNFRASQQDLNLAKADYYPRVDLRATSGYTKSGGVNSSINKLGYSNYESSLIMTQNLFDGFSTINKIDYQKSLILVAAYSYMETANKTAFDMTNAYIDVLRAYDMLSISRENVQLNETMLFKVKELFDSGLTTDSEVKKIQSTLSLSRSNLTVQKNNARNAEYTFRRVLGRLPDANNIQKPDFSLSMPSSIENAAMYAIENNPVLLVSEYNIKSVKALYKERKKEYYPKVDLELSQFYNGVGDVNNGFEQADDRFRARVVLSYNLFRGGADRAQVQKNLSKINQEIDIKRDLKRQIIKNLDFSWSSYEMIEKQIVDLKDYSMYSKETLSLYEEEYDLGRRTLLDLLSAQNDFINSKSQIVLAEYDYLLAKYRVLDAMGLLVLGITGDTDEFTSKVNLSSNELSYEVLDTYPNKMDVDNDNISDTIDLCDNSLKVNNIMAYGCRKLQKDSDVDNVLDFKDKCPLTPKGMKVSEDGCALDSDKDGLKDFEDRCINTPFGVDIDNYGCGLDNDLDGVKDFEDKCLDTQLGYKVDKFGCAFDDDNDGVKNNLDKCPQTPSEYNVDSVGCSVSLRLRINFERDMSEVPDDSNTSLKKLADFLNKNSNYKATIIGHTNTIGPAEYNLGLSKKRAQAIKEVLSNYGVDSERMISKGRGEKDPIADNNTEDGLYLNRRVDIELNQQQISRNYDEK